jgi:hypothetical protein
LETAQAGGLLSDTHPIARFEWRTAATGFVIFLLGYFVLLIGIDTPDHPPAATVASLALACCFFRGESKRWLWARWMFLAAALAGFVLFLPLSAASIETSLAGYARLMWFAGWR